MERLKQMSLKRAFFCLTMLFLFMALLCSAFSIIAISNVLQHYGPAYELKINSNTAIIPQKVTSGREFPYWYHALATLQFVLPVLFVLVGLLLADLVFYRIKLKKPLNILQTGAERIILNDLDFSIKAEAEDELGKLCIAFEEMRLELQKNNRELWRQMEERKRLNAAFSHDLRNPVTVLKGSAKILKKELACDGQAACGGQTSQNTLDSVALIEEYAARIETYINAMSSVGRLEELQSTPQKIGLETVMKELSDSIHMLTMESGLNVEEHLEIQQGDVWLDKVILYNVTENLIANAQRYAKTSIQVSMALEEDLLVLSVKDDGPGFLPAILRKGAQPFLRGEDGGENSNHFGMGLYICRLLCEKHKGSLELRNTSNGALTMASFSVRK